MAGWMSRLLSGDGADAENARERLVCRVCGGWIELPAGQVNRAAVDWHAPESAEENERRRLAAELEPFMRRHRAHIPNGEEGIRLYRQRDGGYARVYAGKQEVLGDK